jgi:hypothetical protein
MVCSARDPQTCEMLEGFRASNVDARSAIFGAVARLGRLIPPVRRRRLTTLRAASKHSAFHAQDKVPPGSGSS